MKKLSVVMFLPLPMNGSMKVMTMLLLCLWVDGHDSSLPRYGTAFRIYLDSSSTGNQNLMPNLSGLFDICWVNLQLVKFCWKQLLMNCNIFSRFVTTIAVIYKLIPDIQDKSKFINFYEYRLCATQIKV